MYFWEGQPCETDIFDLGLKVWFKLKTKVIILLNILIKVNYIDNGNGLLTRKYISLDNPLWKWICFPWLLFFFISFLFLEASFISELDVSACLLWRFCFYRILLPTRLLCRIFPVHILDDIYCFSARVRCLQVVMVTPPSLALLPPLMMLSLSSSLTAP